MIKSEFSSVGRSVNEQSINADLVFIGGGISGTCGAIAAAREGLKVILVQDRPVLGGNASSEVRLWILGATSSMGNNNRWSREGGVLSEILIENMYRNPDGNAIILDTILLEKVKNEQNLTLLLNTAVYEVVKSAPDVIKEVIGFCSQNSTRYLLSASFFCDSSGDGIVAFQAGAAFRMGAESKDEFDEGFAPDKEYGELLGHSIYFFTKDAGRPITFTAPSYALKDVSSIVKYRSYDTSVHGCKLWWLEYGGRLDTIHQTEEIKWELWKVIYGIWDHVKNSGKYPELSKANNQDPRNNLLNLYSIPIKLEKIESTKPIIPTIKYETIRSEDKSHLTPIPWVYKNKRIDLQLPKTEVIKPGETNIIDLKIKIFLPKYKNTPILIGQLNIGLEAINVFNIEIKHYRSFIEKDGNKSQTIPMNQLR